MSIRFPANAVAVENVTTTEDVQKELGTVPELRTVRGYQGQVRSNPGTGPRTEPRQSPLGFWDGSG